MTDTEEYPQRRPTGPQPQIVQSNNGKYIWIGISTLIITLGIIASMGIVMPWNSASKDSVIDLKDKNEAQHFEMKTDIVKINGKLDRIDEKQEEILNAINRKKR